MFADRVLYARKGEDVTSQAVTLGGDKITVDDAIVSRNSDHPCMLDKKILSQTLKKFCWGGPNIVPTPAWIKTGVIFHDQEQTNAYGLKAVKGATKAFQLILGKD